ncbi:MAG: Eco57I restriction-modification methylase domain-containing protein [Alphaproteobacteria bacterium]
MDAARITNRRLLGAVFRLGWLRDHDVLTRINWRDMETEELGSVYESLLDLIPEIDAARRKFGFLEQATPTGTKRKSTGSYYTPDSLVQLLLDSALDPVIEDAVANNPDDPAGALLKLTVCDPAAGSGHFLLGAARRIATKLAALTSAGAPTAQDYRHAMREVVRHCLYGVDRNPMAVELCKVALWIESVEPGRPLSFLDAHIRCGDSLIGVFNLAALAEGIPDAAYNPLTGDVKPAASAWKKRNKAMRDGQGNQLRLGFADAPPQLVKGFGRFEQMPEDTVADVAAREAAFAKLHDTDIWQTWKAACDLYVAAFFLPKTEEPPARGPGLVPTTDDVWRRAGEGVVHPPLEKLAIERAEQAGAFHWRLEFPHIFAAGGFDAVIGNPPWERIKLQEKEFFAPLAPEIANAPNTAARRRMIAALGQAEAGTAERRLHDRFERAKRDAEAASIFVRGSGRFSLTGAGDVNTYALFAEHFSESAGPRGRAGVIVPTGIATDATTAPFFAHLVDNRRLALLVDFENRKALFQDVHRSYKFSVLTLGREVERAGFAFFLTETAQLDHKERRFTLTPEDIARINPNTRTAPVFRSRADAELTKKIYSRVPVLIDESKGEDGNPWGIQFATMFHMSNDSGLFRTAKQLADAGAERDGADWIAPESAARHQVPPGRWVPLYEAKMIHQFDHRWATYKDDGESSRDLTSAEKADPNYEPSPRYWVPEAEVTDRLASRNWNHGWLMGWRDVTNATNERTVVADVFPLAAANHKLPLCFVGKQSTATVALLAVWDSVTLDFVARQKVGGTSLTYFYLKQFPVLCPDAIREEAQNFITPRVLELTYTSHSMKPWAEDLGYDGPPFAWDEDAAPCCARSWTPISPASMASPARNSCTFSTPRW